jgi:anionic cell wall polymer biosynthesis LytR-Cps2A-Psr (LCP) family protein
MTSIMGDTYVGIEGYEEEKINHSYAYGGIDIF